MGPTNYYVYVRRSYDPKDGTDGTHAAEFLTYDAAMRYAEKQLDMEYAQIELIMTNWTGIHLLRIWYQRAPKEDDSYPLPVILIGLAVWAWAMYVWSK
jgi:hypothetical protein